MLSTMKTANVWLVLITLFIACLPSSTSAANIYMFCGTPDLGCASLLPSNITIMNDCTLNQMYPGCEFSPVLGLCVDKPACNANRRFCIWKSITMEATTRLLPACLPGGSGGASMFACELQRNRAYRGLEISSVCGAPAYPPAFTGRLTSGTTAVEEQYDVEMFVSPDIGADSDSNPGTLRVRPLATLSYALMRTRMLPQSTRKRIVLLEGTHRLLDTIELTPRDSNLVIEGDSQATSKPILSGALLVDHRVTWREYTENILVADLTPRLARRLGPLSALFINGKPMIRARYPNIDTIVQSNYANANLRTWKERAQTNAALTNRFQVKVSPTGRYGKYYSAIGGQCDGQFMPAQGYFCETNNEAQGGCPYSIPGRVNLRTPLANTLQAAQWSNEPQSVYLHVFHPYKWGLWTFDVTKQTDSAFPLPVGDNGMNAADLHAWQQFYVAAGGDFWSRCSDTFFYPCGSNITAGCTFADQYVTCEVNNEGRMEITEIVLRNNGLMGELEDRVITSMSSLQVLDVSNKGGGANGNDLMGSGTCVELPRCLSGDMVCQFANSGARLCTRQPTQSPTVSPTHKPTMLPTSSPTFKPTLLPTLMPTSRPTSLPTQSPTQLDPTVKPTHSPTVTQPTTSPTPPTTSAPTLQPTSEPTLQPTRLPTLQPTTKPTSQQPTVRPTAQPTARPTSQPTTQPTATPTTQPTLLPSSSPSMDGDTRTPSRLPTRGVPSARVTTRKPTKNPTSKPTKRPSKTPTRKPSKSPTPKPTRKPSKQPTLKPTKRPTISPTRKPSKLPTFKPTRKPTKLPTTRPSRSPTRPTNHPIARPTDSPTTSPTTSPARPTNHPIARPTDSPTTSPTMSPAYDEEEPSSGHGRRILQSTADVVLTLNRGGFQEARGDCTKGGGTEWFVENSMTLLDYPGEYFVDLANLKLYFYPPAGFDHTTATKIELTSNRVLIRALGTSNLQAVRNLKIRNLAFENTYPTHMDAEHEVPSGGDWTVTRQGALVLENVIATQVQQCTFRNLGGNGIFVSRFARMIDISRNDFETLGSSSILLVGDPLFDSPVPYDRQTVNLANHVEQISIRENVMSELGLVVKQSSGVFISIAKSVLVERNVIFDVARAGITINDGYGGNITINKNIVFHTVLETEDHGPFNVWDRQQWLEPAGKLPFEVNDNLFYGNEIGPKGIDLDDGVRGYNSRRNIVFDGLLKLKGSDIYYEDNLLFPVSTACYLMTAMNDANAANNLVLKNNTCIALDSSIPPYYFNVAKEEATRLCATKNLFAASNKYWGVTSTWNACGRNMNWSTWKGTMKHDTDAEASFSIKQPLVADELKMILQKLAWVL